MDHILRYGLPKMIFFFKAWRVIHPPNYGPIFLQHQDLIILGCKVFHVTKQGSFQIYFVTLTKNSRFSIYFFEPKTSFWTQLKLNSLLPLLSLGSYPQGNTIDFGNSVIEIVHSAIFAVDLDWLELDCKEKLQFLDSSQDLMPDFLVDPMGTINLYVFGPRLSYECLR